MSKQLKRRDVLKGAVGMTAAAALGGAESNSATGRPIEASDRFPIPTENAQEGARDWQLTRVRLDHADGVRSPAIEGYCSPSVGHRRESDSTFSSAPIPPARFLWKSSEWATTAAAARG